MLLVVFTILTLEGMKKKNVTQRHGGGGGAVNQTSPSIFKSIQPLNMKLGMCNKCSVYFQLSIATWHLIGFHGNHSNIMTSLMAVIILDFQISIFFSYSHFDTENSKKTTFSDWNLQYYKIHRKIFRIYMKIVAF